MSTTARSFDEVAQVVDRIAGWPRAVVLIDGGAGSGKTTLAEALAKRWPGVQVVSLDSFYPGWSGLAAASRIVAEQVLRPSEPGYHRWDWEAGREAEWVALDPTRPLIVEGCGALTLASHAQADLAIWCELDADERKRRALARDGELFASHWDDWEAQEAEHWSLHRPRDLADVSYAVSQA
jgi:uridine kinase